MEDLLIQQDAKAVSLQQAIANYKKSPLDRKNATYIQKWMLEIKTLWDQFNKADNRIRQDLTITEDHPYYQRNLYDTIGEKYGDIMTKMEHDLRICQATKAQVSISSNSAVDPGNPSSSKTSVTRASFVLFQKQQKGVQTVKSMLSRLLDAENQSVEFYQLNLKSVEQHWSLVQQLHERLWTSDDDYDFDQYVENDEYVTQALCAIHERMNKLSPTDAIRVATNANASMKLPKVELPCFSGDYVKWRQFRDLFIKMVHDQPLPLCQKLCYLQSSVQGEAAKLIQHLTATEDNYEDAWHTLNKRYENKRLLVRALLQRLLSQKPTQAESASSIKALHDTTKECLQGLRRLDIPVDHWDAMLVHMLSSLLDSSTRRLWERSLTDPREVPTMEELIKFLEFQFESEEVMERSKKNWQESSKRNSPHASSALIVASHSCIACKEVHALYQCKVFLNMPSRQRLQLVQGAKICVNCLKADHKAKQCTSSRACNKCGKRHNTLLHLDHLASSPAVETKTNFKDTKCVKPGEGLAIQNQPTVRSGPTPAALAALPAQRNAVLLSTVKVQVADEYGREVICRAILDNGSQINFITQALMKRLGLKGNECHVNIQGIAQTHSQASERVNIKLSSCTTGFSTRLEAQVLPKIVSPQPSHLINNKHWNIPKNLQLADPDFNTPAEIDLLIGAGLFYSVLRVGQINIGNGLPILQHTLFGWIVGGEYCATTPEIEITCAMCADDDLSTAVEKFWEIEEIPTQEKGFTSAELKCERHFIENTRRGIDGRFTVKLPFHQSSRELGQSYDIAAQRFRGIEKRLSRCPELKTQYIKFMHEYEELGHMEEVSLSEIQGPHFFLPHHAVVKPDSTTTKLRVVFDASAKTSTNLSLNDLLSPGPTIQEDVFTELLRFRFPRYAFTADIEKMYRQVWVHQDDRQFQLILWRSDPTQSMKCFQLKTITYGTSSAPYLAIRCLKKLAEDYKHIYPLAANALENNFYVDDVLAGSNDIKTAVDQQTELLTLLNSAGFKLRKWCANDQRLLRQIPAGDQEISLELNNQDAGKVKTMGLIWHPKEDVFSLRSEFELSNKVTKRSALSDISKIFDPLGFMAPVTMKAKIFLQQLWKLKLDWDAALPQDLHTEWLNFRMELQELAKIKFARHVFGHAEPLRHQIHIFADASERAYGAVSYVRSVSKDKMIIMRFLCAKSRVAPTKQITLPRLELCAAKLAVDLKISRQHFYLWSDSTVVLGWIQAESSHYHTFVANRISSIQRDTHSHQWHHVSSQDNPADMLSRGLNPNQLVNSYQWLYGPAFLHGAIDTWTHQQLKVDKCSLEQRKKVETSIAANIATNQCDTLSAINHGNSFRRLQRIIAYVMRLSKPNNPGARLLGKSNIAVRAEEMEDAMRRIVKYMQVPVEDEKRHLEKYKVVQHNSSLAHLTPFIDDKGILRVGGRLDASNLSYEAKHPILLSHLNPFTRILLTDLHKENLHAGVQTLLAISRQRFWVINGKTLARGVIHSCVQCTRAKPKLLQQLMGNLPADRVVPSRPFITTGVDFFGPVYIHFKIRGKKPVKAYVAVFCCFSTKAIHMELVGDLTTEAFIGALKRFMGRRGHCQKIYCDNATNFVGAKNFFEDLRSSIHGRTAQHQILSVCSKANIEFCFIPPRAPHFGGLWEAAVKSAKSLMQKTLASANLTHEELETVLIEAEAILNSRPITPMSSDPNDMTALTPGHFLIGEPLTSTIDPQAAPNNVNLSTRWKLVTHLKFEFWRRWTSEYLQQLQHRYRWNRTYQNVKPGTMVIIKEDNQPPLRWPLGRITNVIHGDDGLVRVVDVRTATTTVKRPIHRLAPLFETIDHTDDESTKNQRNEVATPNAGTSRKRRAVSNIAALLITCLMLPLVFSSSVEIHKFEADPGIYFERIGMAKIIANDWNLINYFDLQPYRREYEITQKYVDILSNVCSSLDGETACQKTVAQIARQVSAIEANEQFLTINDQKARSKRGALNFVGNVANGLFGILDSEYAEQLTRTIDTLKQNDETLKTRIQNQTSFLDRTISIMKRDQTGIEREFKAIEKMFYHTNQQLSNLSQKMQLQQSQATFYELALQASIHISNFQRVQEAVIDILTDAHHGKINPELLTPKELQEELEAIKVTNARSIKLPLATTEIAHYYRIMSISHKINAKYIIFSIKIPLTTEKQFELLKLTAIPWFRHATGQQIKLSTPYLMVDLLREQFYPLSKGDMQECLCIDSVQFLCHQAQPFYDQDAPISSCEVNLLKRSAPMSKCHTVAAGQGPFWVALQESNSWIYSVDTSTQLDVACNSIPSQLTLIGAGILKVGDRCVVKAPYVTLEGHATVTTTRYITYVPAINVSQLTNHAAITNSPRAYYTSSYEPQHEIKRLQNQLAELQTLSFNTVRPHDIHHYGLGYLLLILTVGLIAYRCWSDHRRRQSKNPTFNIPIPAPRQIVQEPPVADAESCIVTMFD